MKNNKFKYQWYHRCALRLNEILNNLWTAESIYLITITYLYKFRKKKLVPHQIIHETPNTSTNFNNSLLSGETFANLNLQIQVPTYWVRHTKKMIEDYFAKANRCKYTIILNHLSEINFKSSNIFLYNKSIRWRYTSFNGGSLNLQRVKRTNFKVWSLPRSSSLQRMSTSRYASILSSTFKAMNFLRWVTVAWDEQRRYLLWSCSSCWAPHSKQMFTYVNPKHMSLEK